MNEYVQKNLKPDEKLVREIELGMTNLVGYIVNMAILLVFGAGFIFFGLHMAAGNFFMMIPLLVVGVFFLLVLAFYIVFMIFEIRNCNSTAIALTDKRLFGKKVFTGMEEIDVPLENIMSLRISIPYFTGGMGIYSNRTLILQVKDESSANGYKVIKFRSVKKAADIVGIIQAEKSRRVYEMNIAANNASAPAENTETAVNETLE